MRDLEPITQPGTEVETKVEPASKLGTPRTRPSVKRKRRSQKLDPTRVAENEAKAAAIRSKLDRAKAPKGSPYEGERG